MQTVSQRGIRRVIWDALTLDERLYTDAHEHPRYRRIAQWIVAFAAISHAIGSTVILLVYRASVPLLLLGFLLNSLSVFLGYYFWTLTIWKIGRWLHRPSKARQAKTEPFSPPSFKDLLSPIGFAHTPQVFNFLTVIPLLGRPIEIGLALWSLLAVIVAVRHGLSVSLWRSSLICGIGWPLVQVAIGVIQIWVQGWAE
ncbi:hypothetical protein C7B76_23055 [filamentous cyanobacterium CCP2]|nr:hypothetical protein C7B76_23055 [filamentous cyanobacterium CCP2]